MPRRLPVLVLGALLLTSVLAAGAEETAISLETSGFAEVAPVAGGTVGEPDTAESRSLRDWYELGGWVMHALAACSVLVLAVVLERLWSLRASAVAPRRLLAGLPEAWNPAHLEPALGLCDESPSGLARLAKVGIRALERGAQPLEAVAAAAETESLQLRRNLALLAALANIATMLGLLGTVLGMIAAFDQIAEVGTGDPRVVAGGIFEALVTTAAGLSVGIVALSFHAYLRRRVDRLLLLLEEFLTNLLEQAATEERAPRAEPAGALAPASP